VGVLRSLTDPKPFQITAIWVGVGIGLAFQLARKILKPKSFIVDAILLPSPYASSFGGFVEFATSMWWGLGGAASSIYNWSTERRAAKKPATDALPEDMSATSLLGGGLLSGDAIAALAIGIFGLLSTLFH